MKLRIISYTLLLFFLVPFASKAQGTENYFSLKDAVRYGVEHHLIIQKSDYELEIYNQKFREELSGYLPQIKADAAYTNNLKLITQIIPGEFIGQPGQDQSIQFGTKYNASAIIDVTQTLVDFEKITGQKIARQNSRISLLNKQKTIEQIIYDIATAYNISQIALLQQNDISQNILKIDTLITSMESRVQNGFSKPVDLKRLQLERTNLQTRLQNAKMEHEQSMTLLKYTMAYPLEETIHIDTRSELTNFGILLQEDLAVKSLDLELLAAQDELTVLSLKQMKQSYLPKLSFNFRYGTLAQQNNPNIFRTNTNWYPNSLASLNLSIPIFDGSYKASRVKQLQLEQHQNSLDIKMQQNELDKNVKNVKVKLSISHSNLFTTKESMALAEEVYAITYLQFQSGYASLKDLLDANTEVKEMQTAYLRSVLEVQSAELELLKVSGNIETILK
ncbi:TolC family protein [Flavobacterium sp. JP2137]|uniref:TolC family protein n=1 Tax=Flavobacterium sp. JP2137 TaxID=3414510 RepID=UPI003D2FB00B